MACKSNITKTKVSNAIRRITGTNNVMFDTLTTLVLEKDNFNNAFKTWYKTKFGHDINYGDDAVMDEVAKTITRYYNELNPDVNYDARDKQSDEHVSMHGYTSVAARSACVTYVTNSLASNIVEHMIKPTTTNSGAIVPPKTFKERKKEYEEKRKTKYTNKQFAAQLIYKDISLALIDKIVEEKGLNAEQKATVRKLVGSRNFAELDKIMHKDVSEQLKNVYACYKELFSNNSTNFLNSVFANLNISEIAREEELDESEIENMMSDNQDEDLISDTSNSDTDSSAKIEEKDNTISNLENKAGLYDTFLKHVSPDIRLYLSSIPCLAAKPTATSENIEVKNPLTGLTQYMDVNQIIGLLYTATNKQNLDLFIASIKEIADSVPGFEGLHKLADDMEANLDFAFQIKSTFCKMAIEKVQSVVDSGLTTVRISNRHINRLDTLTFEYINAVRATSIMSDYVAGYEAYRNIQDMIKNRVKEESKLAPLSQEHKDLYKDVIVKLGNELRKFYPTIDDATIKNFCFNNKINGSVNIANNLKALNAILDRTCKASERTLGTYNAKQAAIIQAKRHNKSLDNKRTESGINSVDNNEYYDLTDLYQQDFLSEGNLGAAIDLAKLLEHYTTTSIELNSYNVHGNQSSDIINNSMITNILETLSSEESLKNFGEYKNQNMQYNFSNIMIEHWEYKKDSNGQYIINKLGQRIPDYRINYGLFRRAADGSLVPTSYAHRLLKARLFNGATDAITSSNVLYSEMSKGDYIATGFINFFTSAYKANQTIDPDGIVFANYFMRTPSDAPKTFLIEAPRYSTKDLFIIENQREVDSKVRSMFKRINNLTEDEYYEIEGDNILEQKNGINRISEEDFINLCSGIANPNIRIYQKSIRKKDGKEYALCQYVDDKDHKKYTFIIEGEIVKKKVDNAEAYFITNTTLTGIRTNDSKFESEAEKGIQSEDAIYNKIDKAYRAYLKQTEFAKIKLNRNHPVFAQLRNAVIQELTDMANVIDTFFQNENGRVILDDDNTKPLFNEGFDNSKECGNKLYKNYHTKTGTILNDKGELTGAVFTSDRLVVTSIDENGNVVERNYGQEFINTLNLLYGEADDQRLATAQGAKGKVVVLTNNQKQLLDDNIEKFIYDIIQNTTERIDTFSEFIPEGLTTEENITEFALNYHLAYIYFNDLYEGDTKFYKNSQTFLKRAKEVQGSGIPYAIADFSRSLLTPREEIPSILNSMEFAITRSDGSVDVLNKYVYEQAIKEGKSVKEATKLANSIKQTNKFRGATVKNTISTSKTIGTFKRNSKGDIQLDEHGVPIMLEKGPLTKNLEKALLESGLSKQEAADKVATMMAGYIDTTVNDAQSYITFEEFVRRVAAKGQLAKYKPLIDAILDESKPIDVKTIEAFVQVQKNFYYDQHYNAETKTYCPRQIKNAEFVIIPRFVKGTQLEQVYNLMQEFGIDQLNTEETSKAGKANVLTLWNNDSEITEAAVQEFRKAVQNKEAIELYDYNYLYSQQETPQHVNAENKAAIQIMKKILDNISKDSPLYKYKEQFFDLYSENIKESFTEFMNELGVELDDNGNLVLEDGNIKGLNPKVFFDRLKEEVTRLGLDSNALDYVTLSGSTVNPMETLMPVVMSIFSNKLESIAQSMFNNRITRQKLPGFHAAQVTSVGYSPLDGITESQYSNELQYHPNGEPYIEIKLPKNAFNFKRENKDGSVKTDEQLLKELQDSGLDTLIGYRIPTEGKQSICVMKVVGFVDDAQGSTIIVPDGWVSQTGSDFDIDSVYGITYNSYIDGDGILRKKKFKTKENLTVYDWFRYITNATGEHIDGITDESFNKAKQDAKKSTSKKLAAAKKEAKENKDIAESILWGNLDAGSRNAIKALHREFRESINKTNKEPLTKDEYQQQLQYEIDVIINQLKENKNIYTKGQKKVLKQFKALKEETLGLLTGDIKEDIDFDYNAVKSQELQSELDKIRLAQYEYYAFIAYEAGLKSFEDFKNDFDAIKENDRNARNNQLLTCMISILQAPQSLEENLSRSNFENLIDARDGKKDSNGKRTGGAISETVKELRDKRSPYNFLDQADYQEDAMSGAKLKALSVVRDTLCSICNTVQARLSGGNEIICNYRPEDGYNKEALIKSFGKENVNEIIKNGEVIAYQVTHTTFGWTNDYRDTKGMLLTCYSSQTTAHILDAIKEGNIPNVNDYTFQVYKIFPDIGSDYETAVAFMSQPAVERIVKAYNASKSIYSRSNKSPIDTAVKEIIKELNEIDPFLDASVNINTTPVEQLLATLNSVKGTKFSLGLDYANRLAFDAKKYKDRNNRVEEFSDSHPVERLLFDLNTAIQFNKLYVLGGKISSYTRVLNPDKFGAKQTLFATNDVFDRVHDLLAEEKPVLVDETGKSILHGIYPGIDGSLDEFISNPNMDSTYKPLLYFMKYATAISIKVNKMLFPTQTDSFVAQIKSINSLFSGTKKLDEKTYKDFQTYVINDIYKHSPFIINEITFVKGEGLRIVDKTDTNDATDGKVNLELSRIHGYNASQQYEFSVADINDVTEEEIAAFVKLTPAQKVHWIQQNYKHKGIFEFIKPNLFDSKYNGSRVTASQTLSFVDIDADIETVYDLFYNAFNNNNPLVALAAADVIKYAFVVEGFRMKHNGVSKIISNKVLKSQEDGFTTGIVQFVMDNIANIKESILDFDTLKTNFIRSNVNTDKIATYWVKRGKNKVHEIVRRSQGIIILDANHPVDKDLLDRYGFIKNESGNVINTNAFVKLSFNKNEITLYKISSLGNGLVMAYPVNTLEYNENSEWSVNEDNNKYPSAVYYEMVKDKVIATALDKVGAATIITDLGGKTEGYTYKRTPKVNEAKPFDINEKNTQFTGGFEAVVNAVKERFEDPLSKNLIIRSNALTHFIGKGQSSIQTIMIKGVPKQFVISKTDTSYYNKRYRDSRKSEDKIAKLLESEPNKDIARMYEGDAKYIITDAYTIVPVDAEIQKAANKTVESEITFDSSITEVNTSEDFAQQAVKTTIRFAQNGNESAKTLVDYFNRKDITPASAKTSLNTEDVLRVTSEFVVNSVDDIINSMNHFMRKENGEGYCSILDPKVQDKIKTDKKERDRFLKLVLDARAIVANYKDIYNLNIDTEDELIRPYLTKIKNAINNLDTLNIIKQAEDAFALGYLTSLTENPNIRGDIQTLLDGFHSASSFDAWINDLQETSSPLLQIITKEVMADIRAQEMKAKKLIKEFRAKIEDFKERAKQAGVNIDWDHIIDEDGKFIQDYNQAFIDKLEELQDGVRQAVITHGENSLEHLKAKLEYDKFKAKHLKQPVKDDYYHKKIALEERMLTNFPGVYCKYKQLVAERIRILNHAERGKLDTYWQAKLDEVNEALNNVTSKYVYDSALGGYVKKKSIQEIPSTVPDRKIYSLEASVAISDYIKESKELNADYFDYEERADFREKLQECLDIIEAVEEKDPNGKPTIPLTQRMRNEKYVKAKEWLRNNAKFVLSKDTKDWFNDLFKTLNEKKEGRDILKRIAKKENAYDSYGRIDATKFSTEQIAAIKQEQASHYGITENSPFSDRTLISNSPTDDMTIFKKDFYDGMRAEGASNPQWLAKVNEINNLLRPYFDKNTGIINTSDMTEEELNKLALLYDELEGIKKVNKDESTSKRIGNFIHKNVDFIYNEKAYDEQEALAKNKGNRYYAIWRRANQQLDENFERHPNRFLYGRAVPKGYNENWRTSPNPNVDKWIDKKKSDAIVAINSYCTTRYTSYYYDKLHEMRNSSKEEFETWYEANHIYNPHTHTVEPIACWTYLDITGVPDNSGLEINYEWTPGYYQQDQTIRLGMDNSNHKKDLGRLGNFKNLHDEYSNDKAPQGIEKELRDYVQETLTKLASIDSAKKYFAKGYLPTMAKGRDVDAKFIADEALKFIGWIEGNSGREAFNRDIDYANDRIPNMPMTTRLNSKETLPLTVKYPKKEDFEDSPEGIAQYNEAVLKYKEEKKKVDEHNNKIHQDLLNRNWEEVIETFIERAAHFNAVQENKFMLFYAQNMIKKLDTYVKTLGFNNFQVKERDQDGNPVDYVTQKDVNLQEQYANWLRRLIYDQWKMPNGNWTRGANVLQSLVSSKFMMLNITGGIANITVGETNILGEAFAEEYFGKKQWAQGAAMWHKAIGSFLSGMYQETSTTVEDAICKFMDVVDFDEHTGVVREVNLAKTLSRIRDGLFSPQTIGEHFMQNSAMFSMMLSHRLFIDHDKTNGIDKKYKLMNEHEYTFTVRERVFESFLTDEQKEKFKKFKDSIKADPNETKEFAWYRNDVISQFARLYLTKEQQQAFNTKVKEATDEAIKEFNDDKQHPTLYSQLTLGEDKTLGFAKGSIFEEIGDQAYDILGRFKGRVISVNKKIHGVYDRFGSAQIEKHWWGSLVMQYHKHIYPGIMKRYRRQGYYNEERGTIEKGRYNALIDFLSIPITNRKFRKTLQANTNATEEELELIQGTQNLFKDYIDFIATIKINWNLIPEYERANLRRSIGDMIGVLGSVCLAIGLRALGGDDDDNGFVYNLAMYELDRLNAESFMFNPIGAVSEAKKLYSSPVAIQSSFEDAFSAMGFIAQYIIQGDDFDPYYQTGLFAGENKLWVMFRRNIPVYHSINMLTRLNRSNKYYKLGDTMMTIVPVNSIGDWVGGRK